MLRTVPALLVALALSPAAALADSQSSNSSSNCSNGRCSRVESYREEGRGYRHGWVREERWRERDGEGPRREWRGPAAGWLVPFGWVPRRGREDDD